MAGGRIVSANGQIYYQHCSLNAERLPAALADQLRDPRQMPAGFYVGSNPDGKPTVIAIANYPIPFTNPSPRQFIGMHDRNIYHNTTEQESWYSNATELLIAYWLATLLPALFTSSSTLTDVSMSKMALTQKTAKHNGGANGGRTDCGRLSFEHRGIAVRANFEWSDHADDPTH